MSIAESDTPTFEAVRARHRLLLWAGVGAIAVGVVLAAYVTVEWFVPPQTSHEVVAVVAGVSVLLGVQLLVFSTLTSMLLALHAELLARGEDSGE